MVSIYHVGVPTQPSTSKMATPPAQMVVSFPADIWKVVSQQKMTLMVLQTMAEHPALSIYV